MGAGDHVFSSLAHAPTQANNADDTHDRLRLLYKNNAKKPIPGQSRVYMFRTRSTETIISVVSELEDGSSGYRSAARYTSMRLFTSHGAWVQNVGPKSITKPLSLKMSFGCCCCWQTVSDLVEDVDDKLFTHVLQNKEHILLFYAASYLLTYFIPGTTETIRLDSMTSPLPSRTIFFYRTWFYY